VGRCHYGSYLLRHYRESGLQFPIIGVPEIVKVSIVAIAWMQMAHTLKIGAHLRSEIILDRLPSRSKAFVNLLAYSMGAFIFAMVVFFRVAQPH